MIYVKFTEGEGYVALPDPVYVIRQKNGIAVRTDKAKKAQGLLDPEGRELWQLLGREPLGDTCATVELVSLEEYEANADPQPEEDPEDTQPEIPEGVEETDILTRAELTERVRQLEEELAKAMALLYPQGEEDEHEP